MKMIRFILDFSLLLMVLAIGASLPSAAKGHPRQRHTKEGDGGSSPDRGTTVAQAAPRVGAIRWDDWAGPGLDITQDSPLQCLSPEQYHYRLPFFAHVINSTAVTWCETKQDVIDQEIEYASAGGLSYWAFCTYPLGKCDQDAPSNVSECPLSWALETYLKSSVSHKINFSLILQAHWSSWPNVSDWDRKVERYSSYFAMGNYEKVFGGQPLVFLFGFSEGSLAPFGGSKGFVPYLKKLTDASKSMTGQVPYYCLTNSDISLADALSIPCLSSYAVSGGTPEGTPYVEQMKLAHSHWESWKQAGKHVIPQAPTGWDPRPRYNHTPPWSKPHAQGLNHFITAKPSEVGTMLDTAFKWVDANPTTTPSRHVLMYAWNEGTEGGWLWPTLQESTARLDAIKEVIDGYPN